MSIDRGEVWLVNLDPTVGDEIRKTRPAIVMSSDKVGNLGLRVIVPLTAWQDRYRVSIWDVRIDPETANGLHKVSSADALQVRSVSVARLAQRLGRVTSDDVARIWEARKAVLEP